jgi:hypothetical protein
MARTGHGATQAPQPVHLAASISGKAARPTASRKVIAWASHRSPQTWQMVPRMDRQVLPDGAQDGQASVADLRLKFPGFRAGHDGQGAAGAGFDTGRTEGALSGHEGDGGMAFGISMQDIFGTGAYAIASPAAGDRKCLPRQCPRGPVGSVLPLAIATEQLQPGHRKNHPTSPRKSDDDVNPGCAMPYHLRQMRFSFLDQS